MPQVQTPVPTSKADLETDRLALKTVEFTYQARMPQREVLDTGGAPDKMDLSNHLRYIRDQDSGPGCWGYSMLAVWDIKNDLVCPYSPNLSMRQWLMLHHRRDLWEHGDPPGLFSPDGRFHKMKKDPDEEDADFQQSFGCVSEGTEQTARSFATSGPDIGWSTEGVNEADNFRLKCSPIPIDISSSSFVHQLSDNQNPIRICTKNPNGQGHCVAIVGYDKAAQRFKYVNSVGDKWGDAGFHTFTFTEIDTRKVWGSQTITSAVVIEIVDPKPVPAARILISHNRRGNLHLWLYAENSPLPRRKIWPQGWNENCSNLHCTVRLPSEFIWPPAPDNRIGLELYDSAAYSTAGGALEKFEVAFGGVVLQCSQLSAGPVSFGPRDHLHFHVP